MRLRWSSPASSQAANHSRYHRIASAYCLSCQSSRSMSSRSTWLFQKIRAVCRLAGKESLKRKFSNHSRQRRNPDLSSSSIWERELSFFREIKREELCQRGMFKRTAFYLRVKYFWCWYQRQPSERHTLQKNPDINILEVDNTWKK